MLYDEIKATLEQQRIEYYKKIRSWKVVCSQKFPTIKVESEVQLKAVVDLKDVDEGGHEPKLKTPEVISQFPSLDEKLELAVDVVVADETAQEADPNTAEVNPPPPSQENIVDSPVQAIAQESNKPDGVTPAQIRRARQNRSIIKRLLPHDFNDNDLDSSDKFSLIKQRRSYCQPNIILKRRGRKRKVPLDEPQTDNSDGSVSSANETQPSIDAVAESSEVDFQAQSATQPSIDVVTAREPSEVDSQQQGPTEPSAEGSQAVSATQLAAEPPTVDSQPNSATQPSIAAVAATEPPTVDSQAQSATELPTESLVESLGTAVDLSELSTIQDEPSTKKQGRKQKPKSKVREEAEVYQSVVVAQKPAAKRSRKSRSTIAEAPTPAAEAIVQQVQPETDDPAIIQMTESESVEPTEQPTEVPSVTPTKEQIMMEITTETRDQVEIESPVDPTEPAEQKLTDDAPPAPQSLESFLEPLSALTCLTRFFVPPIEFADSDFNLDSIFPTLPPMSTAAEDIAAEVEIQSETSDEENFQKRFQLKEVSVSLIRIDPLKLQKILGDRMPKPPQVTKSGRAWKPKIILDPSTLQSYKGKQQKKKDRGIRKEKKEKKKERKQKDKKDKSKKSKEVIKKHRGRSRKDGQERIEKVFKLPKMKKEKFPEKPHKEPKKEKKRPRPETVLQLPADIPDVMDIVEDYVDYTAQVEGEKVDLKFKLARFLPKNSFLVLLPDVANEIIVIDDDDDDNGGADEGVIVEFLSPTHKHRGKVLIGGKFTKFVPNRLATIRSVC